MIKRYIEPSYLYIHYTSGAKEQAEKFLTHVEKSCYTELLIPSIYPIKTTSPFEAPTFPVSNSNMHVLFIDNAFFPLPMKKEISSAIQTTFTYSDYDELSKPIIVTATDGYEISKTEKVLLDSFWFSNRKDRYWIDALTFPFDNANTNEFNVMIMELLLLEKYKSTIYGDSALAKETISIERYCDRQKERLTQANSNARILYIKRNLSERRGEIGTLKNKMLNLYEQTNLKFIKQFLNDADEIKIYELEPDFSEVSKANGFLFDQEKQRLNSLKENNSKEFFSLKLEGAVKIDLDDIAYSFYEVLIPENFKIKLTLNTNKKICVTDGLKNLIGTTFKPAIDSATGTSIVTVEYFDGSFSSTSYDILLSKKTGDEITLFNGSRLTPDRFIKKIDLTLLFTLDNKTYRAECSLNFT